MAKKTEVKVMEWPRHIPTTWRDRGTLRHLVMCFDDDGEEMVVSKWYSHTRGWQYVCERFEIVRMQISLEAGEPGDQRSNPSD